MVKDTTGVWRAGNTWDAPPPETALCSRQAGGGLLVPIPQVDELVSCQPRALLSAPSPASISVSCFPFPRPMGHRHTLLISGQLLGNHLRSQVTWSVRISRILGPVELSSREGSWGTSVFTCTSVFTFINQNITDADFGVK